MSGPICPVCTTFALIETHEHYSCPICGWSGESPPRKIMDAKTSQRISNKTKRLLDLRMSNKLRYVRVELSADEETRSGALMEIIDIFNMDTIMDDEPVGFFVEGEKVAHVDEIALIPGVEKVSIF